MTRKSRALIFSSTVLSSFIFLDSFVFNFLCKNSCLCSITFVLVWSCKAVLNFTFWNLCFNCFHFCLGWQCGQRVTAAADPAWIRQSKFLSEAIDLSLVENCKQFRCVNAATLSWSCCIWTCISLECHLHIIFHIKARCKDCCVASSNNFADSLRISTALKIT